MGAVSQPLLPYKELNLYGKQWLTELHEVGLRDLGAAGSLKSLKSAPCMGAVVP